jgi:hypothetical protein
MHRRDKGGRVDSFSSSPSSKDPVLGGYPPPTFSPPDRRRAMFSLSLYLSLSPSPHFLIGGMLRLPPCYILRRVDISRLTTTSPKTLRMVVSAMKI